MGEPAAGWGKKHDYRGLWRDDDIYIFYKGIFLGVLLCAIQMRKEQEEKKNCRRFCRGKQKCGRDMCTHIIEVKCPPVARPIENAPCSLIFGTSCFCFSFHLAKPRNLSISQTPSLTFTFQTTPPLILI